MSNKRRILVRVDGSKLIGLGHVYNMLTVLEHLNKNEILIVMKSNKQLGSAKFRKYQFKVKFFSTRNEFQKIIEKFQPSVIVNDLLNTTISYIKFLKKFNCMLVNFEDLGPGRKYADLVFNPIYYASSSSKKEFYGHKYACVRSEFRKSIRPKTRKTVKKVVVTFGGTDPTNKTQNVIRFIQNEQLRKIQWNIILGLGYSRRKEIKKIAKKMNKGGYSINIVEKTDNISEYIQNSDFAITSNGRTVFELAAMKIPMISIAVNHRERQHSFVMYTKSGFHIDSPPKLKIDRLSANVKKMMNEKNRLRFINNMKKADLLHGINRVINEINIHAKF